MVTRQILKTRGARGFEKDKLTMHGLFFTTKKQSLSKRVVVLAGLLLVWPAARAQFVGLPQPADAPLAAPLVVPAAPTPSGRPPILSLTGAAQVATPSGSLPISAGRIPASFSV